VNLFGSDAASQQVADRRPAAGRGALYHKVGAGEGGRETASDGDRDGGVEALQVLVAVADGGDGLVKLACCPICWRCLQRSF
jgi:hypothetical protein